GKRPLEEWVLLLESLDCCVSPVLTPAEAAQHPLFNREAYAAMNEDQAENDAGEDGPPDRSSATEARLRSGKRQAKS
ncbi:MAG TPA: CoA transferase, partial [Paraburkholderia sp.]|nr:CoA transferase [Paraburkholderia sp.]